MITVRTISFFGIEVKEIEVQLSLTNGIPNFSIVGLGDKAITESKERIKSSMAAIGLSLPPKKITVNLAPADLLKEGTHFDLPIAVAVLIGLGVLEQSKVKNFIFLGELSLDGSIRAVSGVLPSAMYAVLNETAICCPYENGPEAAWGGEKLEILAVKHISHIINHFKGVQIISRPIITKENIKNKSDKDFGDVLSQKIAKRALAIAAAGEHNILMIGSPGSGKSMLASRFNTILPALEIDEMLEVSMIYSVSGLIRNGTLSTVRPFRNPHHSASLPSIVGGGKNSKPGEISLAHCGVLFLDELPEFPRQIIDSLRQPIEDKEISISRINSKITYPAKFQILAAMNPCKCGFYKSKKICKCGDKAVSNYQGKISGPIIDRIDIKIWMQNEKYDVKKHQEGEKDPINSIFLKEKVLQAREIQKERYKNYNIKTNNQLEGELLKKYCIPKTEDLQKLISDISEKRDLSMRSINKILKVARTVADFEESQEINKTHLEEAIFYNTEFVN